MRAVVRMFRHAGRGMGLTGAFPVVGNQTPAEGAWRIGWAMLPGIPKRRVPEPMPISSNGGGRIEGAGMADLVLGTRRLTGLRAWKEVDALGLGLQAALTGRSLTHLDSDSSA